MTNLLPLTLLLLGVFSLSMLASYLQHRYYLRVVNTLARDYRRSGYVLATGRRKGRLRGAVAVLVVRRDDPGWIERVMVMCGSTVVARFRERPDLTGRADDARLAACRPVVRGAVEDALRRARDVAGREMLPGSEPGTAPAGQGGRPAVTRRARVWGAARQAVGGRR